MTVTVTARDRRDRTCELCGHVDGGAGDGDVRWWWEHVGGRGYQERRLCRDRTACWRRWDEVHLVPLLRRGVARLNGREVSA